MLDWPRVPGQERAHLLCSGDGRVSISHLWVPHWRICICMRGGCEVAMVDQRSMTEVPCVRLVQSPMPPMLCREPARTLSLLQQHHPTTTHHRQRHAHRCVVQSHAAQRRVPCCKIANVEREGTRTTSLIFLVALLSVVGVALVALRFRLGSMV